MRPIYSAMVLALAAPLLGACSHQQQVPVQPVPETQPQGQAAMLPGSQASELEPGFDPSLLQSVDPQFRQAVANYAAQVDRLRRTDFQGPQRLIAQRLTVDLLADAIATVPNVQPMGVGQAAEVIHAYVAPSQMQTAPEAQQMQGALDGMRAASAVLLGLANGPFRTTPQVQQHALAMRQAVLPPPGGRLESPNQSFELAARHAVSTLHQMEMALAQGNVVQ